MCLHIFFLSIVLGTKVPNDFRTKFWVAFYAMQNCYKLFVWHNHKKTAWGDYKTRTSKDAWWLEDKIEIKKKIQLTIKRWKLQLLMTNMKFRLNCLDALALL